jgi:hypothetical protein
MTSVILIKSKYFYFYHGMKKIVVSILAIFYLTSSVGATVHLHYCMDKLINWSLMKGSGDKCDKCGMQKDGGCCKDENKFVKNSVDQTISSPAVQFTQVLSVATNTDFITVENYSSSFIEEYPICHAPPLLGAGEIYILYCVFRI